MPSIVDLLRAAETALEAECLRAAEVVDAAKARGRHAKLTADAARAKSKQAPDDLGIRAAADRAADVAHEACSTDVENARIAGDRRVRAAEKTAERWRYEQAVEDFVDAMTCWTHTTDADPDGADVEHGRAPRGYSTALVALAEAEGRGDDVYRIADLHVRAAGISPPD